MTAIVDLSQEKFTLGKGRLLFNELVSGSYTGLIPFGNVPELSTSFEIETLSVYSSMEGLKQLALDQVISVAPKIAFVVNNMTARNFGLNTMGTRSTITQASATAETFEFTSKKFAFFDTGSRSISGLSIPTYTAGTDFIVYEEMGYIFIPATSTIADDTTVTATFDVTAKEYETVSMFTRTAIEGKMDFLGTNPFGYKPLWQVPKLSLRPSGDLAFISESDVLSMAFEATLISDAANNPSYPYGKISFL